MQSQNFHFIKQVRCLPYFKKATLPSKKVFPLHTVITSCGHEIVTNSSYSHNGMKRGKKPFAFLQYTLDGEGTLQHEKDLYSLKKGNCMLGIIPHNHMYYIPTHSQHWEFVYLTFAGSEALRILQIVQNNFGPSFSITSSKTLSLFLQILEKATMIHEDIFEFSSLAYSFLMSLIHTMFNKEYANTKSIVNKIAYYCKEHYQYSITINDISKAMHMSKYHLARVFHQESGTTIQKFIELQRMQQAIFKLTHSTQSIKSIAQQCGFSNATYFTVVFKKHYGYTPSEFLKQRNS